MNYRLVLSILGIVLMGEAVSMLPSALIAFATGDGDLSAFLLSAAITVGAGALFTLLRPREARMQARDGFATVGAIAIVLAGAFPLVHVITKLFRKPLMKLGSKLGVNDVAAGGLIATLANSIATFERVKDMDERGKVVNVAFAVSAAFVFGDHMGFTAGFAPTMLPAMIVGKLAGGVTAVAVALLLTRKKA